MPDALKNMPADHALFKQFTTVCTQVLNAGCEYAAKADPADYEQTMRLVAEERALPRLVVTWDRLYALVTVDVVGHDEGGEVSLPLFQYRLHREKFTEAH